MTDSEKLDLLINKMESIDDRMNTLANEVKGIKLHIENVTDKNIVAVAEGHLDLSRKLDDALRINNEKEIMKIRLNALEGEVKQIKQKLGYTL